MKDRRLNNPSDYQYSNFSIDIGNFSLGIDLMFIVGLALGWLIGKKY